MTDLLFAITQGLAIVTDFWRELTKIGKPQCFILGICRGNIPPEVLYSPKKNLVSFCIVLWIPLKVPPPKVSDSPQTTGE